MSEERKIAKRKKARLLYGVIALAVCAAVFAGVTLAWFYNGLDMETLISLQAPSNISILEPDENKALETISLTGGSEQKENGKVSLKKVFRVKSKGAFQLEIAHTTNLKGLEFALYPASLQSGEDYPSTINENGTIYYYKASALDGDYINLDKAKTTADYKYADNTLHAENYNSQDKVQVHAEPLYWLSKTYGENSDTISGKDYFFVCEVTWTETKKETDLFYILAEQIGETA